MKYQFTTRKNVNLSEMIFVCNLPNKTYYSDSDNSTKKINLILKSDTMKMQGYRDIFIQMDSFEAT